MKRSLIRFIRKTGNYFLSYIGCQVTDCSPCLMKKRREIAMANVSYIRKACLMLAANEINSRGLRGNVAELGVYRGDFAKEINLAFPDKELYLFDTFEGFDQRDIASEVQNAYSAGTQDFRNTSVDMVLRKMEHPENCKIVKGFFPDSLAQISGGKNWKFCFVSIDADLFEPIYAGLCYFYPRLEVGGYVFVHDFLNDEYKGAAEAVRKFSGEYGAAYCVLPDSCGTVVFAK